MVNSTEPGYSNRTYAIRDIMPIFFRHLKKTIALSLAILAAAILLLVFAPRTYRSEAKLYLQIGRESVRLDPTATTGERISVQQMDRSQEITSVIDMLLSRGVLEKLIDRLGPEVVLAREELDDETEVGPLEKLVDTTVAYTVTPLVGLMKSIDPISQREEAIVRVSKNLDVYSERDSSMVTIRYETKNPELAKLVTQNLVEIYRSEHLRIHSTSGSKQFFAEQHKELGDQLNQAIEELNLAKNKMNMVSIDLRRTTLEDRLAKIQLTSYENLQEVASAEAEVANLRSQTLSIPQRIVAEDTTVPNTGTDALREKLYELQVLQMDQEARFSSDHPALQNTRKQVRQAQAILETESLARQETTSDMNPNHQALSLELATAETKLAAADAARAELASQRQRILSDLATLNDSELKIDQLQRQVQIARGKYFRYAENLEQARIDAELNKQRISNVIVAQEASFVEKPVSPNKLVVLALTAVLIVAASLALICLYELLRTPIHSKEQLERVLELPVFGVVAKDRKLAGAIS